MAGKTFVRILAIIFGIVAIVLTIMSFAYGAFGLDIGWIVLVLFSITMMINGVDNIVEGYAKASDQKLVKVLKIVFGIVVIIIAFIVFFGALADPTGTLEFMYYVFSIAVIILGIEKIIGGAIAKDERVGYRVGQIFLGGFYIIIAIIILVYYNVGAVVVILFIQISLIINGILMIYYGATGQKSDYKPTVLQ